MSVGPTGTTDRTQFATVTITDRPGRSQRSSYRSAFLGPAAHRACREVRATCSLRTLVVVEDGAHLVGVPTVGVVVGKGDRGGFPVSARLDAVDRVDQEVLFVERVGAGGVAVLVDRGLEVAHCWHLPGVHGVPEVGQV